MDETPDSKAMADEARTIVFLRRLVTVVTATMVLGMLAVAVVVALRLGGGSGGQPPLLPDRITLPEGAKARAVTIGEGYYLVVTDRDEVLIYDRATGALRQRVPIE